MDGTDSTYLMSICSDTYLDILYLKLLEMVVYPPYLIRLSFPASIAIIRAFSSKNERELETYYRRLKEIIKQKENTCSYFDLM